VAQGGPLLTRHPPRDVAEGSLTWLHHDIYRLKMGTWKPQHSPTPTEHIAFFAKVKLKTSSWREYSSLTFPIYVLVLTRFRLNVPHRHELQTPTNQQCARGDIIEEDDDCINAAQTLGLKHKDSSEGEPLKLQPLSIVLKSFSAFDKNHCAGALCDSPRFFDLRRAVACFR
jgi:hypothetical protein